MSAHDFVCVLWASSMDTKTASRNKVSLIPGKFKLAKFAEGNIFFLDILEISISVRKKVDMNSFLSQTGRIQTAVAPASYISLKPKHVETFSRL